MRMHLVKVVPVNSKIEQIINIMLGNINQNPIAKQLKIIFIFLIWFNIN